MSNDAPVTREPVRPILSNEASSCAAAVEEESENVSECGVRDDGVRRVNFKRKPKEPTEREIAEHKITHMPYRSWCPHCVAASAKASPHMKLVKEDDERCVPFFLWRLLVHEG